MFSVCSMLDPAHMRFANTKLLGKKRAGDSVICGYSYRENSVFTELACWVSFPSQMLPAIKSVLRVFSLRANDQMCRINALGVVT